jgi:hypothetical protein
VHKFGKSRQPDIRSVFQDEVHFNLFCPRLFSNFMQHLYQSPCRPLRAPAP